MEAEIRLRHSRGCADHKNKIGNQFWCTTQHFDLVKQRINLIYNYYLLFKITLSQFILFTVKHELFYCYYLLCKPFAFYPFYICNEAMIAFK